MPCVLLLHCCRRTWCAFQQKKLRLFCNITPPASVDDFWRCIVNKTIFAWDGLFVYLFVLSCHCTSVHHGCVEHALCGYARQTLTQLQERCAISCQSVVVRVLSSNTDSWVNTTGCLLQLHRQMQDTTQLGLSSGGEMPKNKSTAHSLPSGLLVWPETLCKCLWLSSKCKHVCTCNLAFSDRPSSGSSWAHQSDCASCQALHAPRFWKLQRNYHKSSKMAFQKKCPLNVKVLGSTTNFDRWITSQVALQNFDHKQQLYIEHVLA